MHYSYAAYGKCNKEYIEPMQYNFALRVFDDTGKSFLENYIGRDYSDTLPTLEERHAIAIGKGIGLKQPVILQLNDMKYLQTNDGEKIVEKNECVDVETEEITPNL